MYEEFYESTQSLTLRSHSMRYSYPNSLNDIKGVGIF